MGEKLQAVGSQSLPTIGDPRGASWGVVDVEGIVHGLVAGTLRTAQPAVLARDDGQALLYPGKVNGIHAESGTGKSLMALYAAAQEIMVGHRVVYLDYEDSPRDVIGRLLDLGVEPESIVQRFDYRHPEDRFLDAPAELLHGLSARPPSLIVIDSTGESIATEGKQPNADDEVAAWFRELPKQLAKCGAAVLVIDHMPKASDRDLWPIGSQRKRAAIDGAQYLMETRVPFSKGKPGRAVLRCAKDRHGNFARGEVVAIVVVASLGARLGLSLEAPLDDASSNTDSAHEAVMERMSAALASAAGPLNYSKVCEVVGGKRDYHRPAMDALLAGGYVKFTTAGRAQLYSLVRPFSRADLGGGTNSVDHGEDSVFLVPVP